MKKILFSSLLLLSSIGASAQSDGCTGVPTLTPGASCTTTNFSLPGTFADGGIVSSTCATGNNRDDGWYSFTATTTSTTITITAAANDVCLAIWSACGGGTELGCNLVATGGTGSVTLTTVVSTTYYVQLHRQSGNNGASANGTVCVVAVSPPSNDNCAGATSVTQQANGSCVTVNGTVASATSSGIANCTGTADDDVWFSFTATNTQAIINRTTTGSWDSGIEIFASTGAAPGSCIGASLGCQDAETAFTVTGLTVGMNYYVRVYSWGSGVTPGTPTFTFCITSPAALPPGSIVMANGSTSACSGTFYDPGGTSDYANSTPITVMTICPSTAGAKLQALFTAFQTESTTLDYLEIFDGNSVAAPSLGVYGGTTSPGTITASASNASGCLTFRFRSDGSVVYSGWVATLSCIIPCQTITANFVSSNEAPAGDGIVRICQGESVNLVGSGTFGTSGTGATYAWSMGNGVTVSGANINYTYPAVGSYLANLVVTDPNGCTNSNALNRQIQVSTTPTISTSATPSTLCTTQTSALAATVTMTPYVINCTPPVSGTTFLPDGTGVSYSTSITTNCYAPGAVVTAATDITNICLNMEHSYSGDLSLAIQCPNGQTVNLLTYPSGNGSANLGTPWATSTVDGSSATTTPGVGANYCFSMTGGTTWTSGALSGGTFVSGNGPGTYTDTYMPAGTYTPQQSFAGLVGCPLNGNWTIQVTDNLGSDNGYIFNWDINFAASFSTASSYTPTIVSQGWVAAPTLTNVNATSANVTPVNQGTPCFDYSVTDNFGCTYIVPQCITVNCGTSLPVGLVSFEANAVSNERVSLTWETSSETNSDYFNIERSVDGENWELIATVDAAGTSVETLNYSTDDENPYNGTSYYRLNQFDLNGALGTTDMEAVYLNFAEGAELILFPNPTTSLVSVKGDLVSLSTFQILNTMGQNVRGQVKTYSQADGSIVLDVSDLAAGIYTVKSGAKAISLVKE
jgi:subtilisin-like proprotein convertase family protein